MQSYSFANIPLASGLRLPELPASAAQARYNIAVTRGAPLQGGLPDTRHDWRDGEGNLNLSLSRRGDTYLLAVPNLMQARIDGARIMLHARQEVAESDVRHSLLNQILPRVLDRDGALMLHAAMVADADKPALLLVGETHYGKSTLTAALAQSGARVFTDDGLRLCVDAGAIRAVPTYPGLRLRPDSHAALVGDRVGAVPPSPTDSTGAMAVGVIVVLNPPGADSGIALQPLPIAAATMALVQNSQAFNPNDLLRARERLRQAAEVAARVPAFRLGYPRDYACLPDVLARLRTLI